MDLSNDLISKFVKITNDDKNKNSESTVYGTVVEYNGGMYVRIDGSDLLTPVETTADFKPNERVTVMIKNHSATVTGNITSPATNEGAVTEKVTEAVEEVEGKVITEVEILIADRVSTKQLDAEVARIDELIAGKASVEDLTATNAEITNLKADKASIKDLTATNAEITNLKAKDAEIENLVAGKATVEDLTATNAEITNLKAKDAEIENLVADKARIEDLTATNARIDSLQANKADITYLDANFATIDELEAAHADIEILDAEVANINTLVNGNLTSDNILSLNITSQNTTMENAFVKDAMIDTVTANKIMSGTIDTNNVTIQSTDGSMLLQGTLLQMKDDNGKVRIQIGKDTGGNFTFILYDESGTGVLIDEEGIKSSDAIADGLIVDAKVADNANIAGSKLNIASVITEVNKDNSTTIKSNKIYLDEQGQSLEVAFNSLKTQVETIQDVTIDGDLTAVIEQVQSNTTQIAANKEGISTLVSENTIRKEEIQNLDGEIESVNNTLSSKYSSLEQDVSGFKTTVADTYTTKSEFNNLQIGGTNLLPKSGNFKDNYGSWVSNGSNISLETVVTYNGHNSIKIDNNTSEGIVYNEYITLKPNTTYTYSITAVASGIVNVGNSTPLHMWVHPPGYDSNPHHEKILDSSHAGIGTTWGRSYVVFKTPDTNDFYLMKPFIYQTEGQVIYVANFKVEEGNRPTDWSPAPEDVQGQIDATNDNLQNNYSTTSAMNSAIQQKANEITSTVSETYTTKSEFNNLQIGGKNLLLDSKREITNNNYLIGSFRPTELFEVGETYTVSICVTPANGVDCIKPFISGGYMGLSNPLYVNGATKQVVSISFTFNGYNLDKVPVDISDSNADVQFYRLPYDETVTSNTTLHWVKVEKGAKATDWTPAPEDVQGQIDATNNNLSTNYSTTSAMNSAIQQKANEITSTVSQTYTTKSETTAIQNQITTSRNLLMGSRDYNLGKWGTERATILDEWYNGTRIYTTSAEWANMDYYVSDLIDRGVIELFTPYTFSCYVMSTGSDYTPNIHFYGDGLPNFSSALCGTATTSWQRISITIEWASFDNRSYPIRFEATTPSPSGSCLRWACFQLERGRVATGWAPAPEDAQYGINDVNNNLVNNYSTTSAMNSAIQQKANEITSTVSETYTTKSEFNNLQIGGKNLLLNSKRETSNNVYCIDEFRPTELFEVGEIYTASICVTPANGVTHIQPYVSGGWSSLGNPLYVNGATKQVVSISFTFNGYNLDKVPVDIYDNNANVQIYRFPDDGTVTSNTTLHWVKVEKGAKATDWTPAPEDVQGQIDATNNNLSTNYSTTSAMNSAIQQKANEITSTVSETYATKSEFNNLQIGGTNLIQNGNFKGVIAGSTSMPSPWTFWGNDIHIYGSHGAPGYNHVGCVYIGCNLTDGSRAGIYSNRVHVSKVEKGANYMASFILTMEGNVKGATAHLEYLNDARDQILHSQVLATARVTNNVVNGLHEHQYHIPFTMWTGDFSYVQITFNHGGTNAPSNGYLMIVGNVQIEKGNKATDWSPAPEDVQGQIDATNANLQNNYSTTSQMNSAIQQKANEITSTVSQTYATKQSVTDINNNLSANYSTTSQMNSAIQQKANEITSSVSQTYISNYEAKKLADTTTTGLNKYLFERYQRDGFDYGTRPTLNDLVGARLIESQLVGGSPGHTSDLGNNYIGVLTFYLYYDYACTKTTIITTDDNGTVYLNNVGIYELTSCQPANVTFNMSKGLNRIDIIYAEGGGGDGVSWGGVDGWSAFGAYANVVTNEIANRTNELTLAMTQGNMLYTDPTFRNGNNGIEIYNNLGNGTVSRERIAAIEGCPNTSGYCMKITTNGEATPGLGGFYFATWCRYNAVYITKITAKIPVGCTIEWATNSTGINSEQKWLSSKSGTGDWRDYYCKVKCGDSGDLSNTNFFYIQGLQATAENPVTWYVSYATVFDVTDSDERITNLTNNLAVNYSTTSQMNSAIQQKANEITSSVSETYATKAETTAVQNQIVTSRNLLMGSRDYNLGKWSQDGATVQYEWYNGTRIYTTSLAWANMNYWVSDLIDRGVIELFTPYTFSCYVMSTGSDYTPSIHFYGDGLPNFHNALCGTATTSWQRISITIEWSSFENRSYPIRFEASTDSPSGSYLKWACFQLERGRVATGWAPAPEDAQYGINDVNNNLANNYSTTSAMNSAIQQKANEITSSVSDTYTTKAEFNNLEVGGTNLIYNGGFNRNLDRWNVNGGSCGVHACTESPSGYMLRMDVTNYGHGAYQVIAFHDSTYCTDYVVSFYAKANVDGLQMYASMEWDPATNTVFTLNGGWQKCVYKFRRSNPGSNALVFYSNGIGTGSIDIHSIKMEKGTVPSAWSPHPSEIENKVDNLSNNLANNYSTTSAMNSAIQQKANEITSSVSQTYATKQSVTDVNNNLVNNYSTTSQMNSAIQQKANEITSSVSQTYITKSETSLINDTVAGNRKWLFEQYTNNQNVGTGNGTYPTLAHLANETLTSSRLVDSLPGSASELGSNYLGVYTVYLYYESAYTWSGSITSDDESTTYLNGVAVCQAPTCTPTTFTMNFKKGINKLQIIHGEGGGGDGVSLSDLGPWKEYGAYPACVTAASSNHYASNSDIVQTANDLTIKFTESGGYNLLQNGHADKGTSYWTDNGGGITTHANAGGGATGNFFGTSLPHGIAYYDWVKLLPNTHYVYQAKVWTHNPFNGAGSAPLHFWFSYDCVNGTADGYTILDYQQNVPVGYTWTQCYIHFVTGNNDIFFKPIIWYNSVSADVFYVTELMLSQSRVVQPWSPHPSEVYSGITQIDKDGIRVHHSNANSYTHMAPDGFFVNNNGTDVVQVTASGLYVQGNITSGSTIQGARITGSTFNSSNDVFQVLEDGSIETSFLAVNGAVSTDKLNVNDIENASYPKVLTEATTVYISPNGGVNAEEFYDGAYFTSLSNMLAVAPRNLNGYTLTIRMAGDLYENAALSWFHSGQVNFEMQGYTLYGYFYGYGPSMCYRLYGNTNSNNNGTWGHIKPNVGRALGSYYYDVQFQYCQFAVNYVAMYPSASSGSSSGGISAHRGATGIVFNAKACGDMRYLVRAEYAGRVHVNSSEGACNNATFCASTGGMITLNSSNSQAGRSTSGNPYWVGSGGIIAADQLLGMDKITFNNTSQSGSSSSSGSTTRKVTETVKASSADTYRSTVYNNWKGDGTVRQGDYGYGDCQGCWFFGNNLYTTMNAGTVTKVVIRIQRQSGGVNALQTLTVKSHNHTSRPSGAPTYTDTIGTCSCAVGSSIDLVITDQTTINKLKNCKGLGLSIGSASSPYAVCSGACSVIITYTTNS